MKSGYFQIIFSIVLFVIFSTSMTGEDINSRPLLVSPGINGTIITVEQKCPTFSWTSVEWATGYKIVVFKAESSVMFTYKEISALKIPVMEREITGKAFSWTPPAVQGLNPGTDYLWYVRAADDFGTEVWSGGRSFRVGYPVIPRGIEEELKGKLKDEGLSDESIKNVFAGVNPDKNGSEDPGKSTDVPEEASGSEAEDETYYGYLAGNGTNGSNNAFFGSQAGDVISAGGDRNSAFGDNAGNSITTGDGNSLFGYFNGQSITTGSGNSLFGRSAGNQNTASYNSMFGWYTGFDNTTGTQNTFFGSEAGRHNTIADSNVFIGYRSGTTNTTGEQNTFIGTLTGEDNTTGSYNTFLGHDSGWESTMGNENTFLGYATGLYNSTGHSNTYVGAHAGYYSGAGYGNTFLGMHAGHGSGPIHYNVLIGYKAGYYEQQSERLYIDVTDTTTPLIYGEFDNNLVRIYGNLQTETSGIPAVFQVERTDGATFKLAAGVANTQIGTISNHGVKFVTNNTWKMRLNAGGTIDMSDGGSYNGTWNDASSIEFKENIREISSDEASCALEELTPVLYNYKKYKDEERAGFIAEHVPEIVANNNRKNLSAMDIVAVLTKVVKEQQASLKEQKKINEKLLKRLEKLEKKK